MAQAPIKEKELSQFKPEDHLTEIKTPEGKMKKYLTVEWAVIWFRVDNPEGTIETEEIIVDLDKEFETTKSVWSKYDNSYINLPVYGKGYARFKTTVCTEGGGKATGYKTCNGAESKNFVERAESGSIRRALSNLGYGTEYSQIDTDEE